MSLLVVNTSMEGLQLGMKYGAETVRTVQLSPITHHTSQSDSIVRPQLKAHLDTPSWPPRGYSDPTCGTIFVARLRLLTDLVSPTHDQPASYFSSSLTQDTSCFSSQPPLIITACNLGAEVSSSLSRPFPTLGEGEITGSHPS